MREGESNMATVLRAKQQEEEIRFMKETLRTKGREIESMSQALSVLRQRENKREQERGSLRGKEELVEENETMHRINEKLKGEIMVLQ